MTELIFILGFITVIILSTTAVLNLGNVSGLRSYRGAGIFFIFIGSWIAGWLSGQLFIPLSILTPVIIQVISLYTIARLSIVKSLIISLVYTLATTAVVLLLSHLTFGS
jgi:hypothetical protein